MPVLLHAAVGAVLSVVGNDSPAPTGDTWRITQYTVTASARSTGGAYALSGSVGQPDAGTLAGGRYAIYGGFWVPASGDRLFVDGFELEGDGT